MDAALNKVPFEGPGTKFSNPSVHSEQYKQSRVFALSYPSIRC